MGQNETNLLPIEDVIVVEILADTKALAESAILVSFCKEPGSIHKVLS